MNKSAFFLIFFPLVLLLPAAAQSVEELEQTKTEQTEESSTQVLQSFNQGDSHESEIIAIDDKTKRIVMFSMGVPLLLLLLATGALGVAMGVYGKNVFVAHMVCAGLSISLAIAHAVAGIVWFYPF